MQVSRAAAERLDEATHCHLHSVYSHSLNLRVGDRLVHLGQKSSPAAGCPFGIDLPLKEWQRVRSAAIDPDVAGAIWEWSSRTGVLLAGPDPVLRIPHAARLRPRDHRLPGIGQPSYAAFNALMGAVHPSEGPGPGLRDSGLATALLSAAAAMADCHQDGADDVLWLVGRGPGLTPSGDDMLVGLLALLSATGRLHPDGQGWLRALLLTEGARLTTEIALEYLLAAMSGAYASAVIDLVTALDRGPRAVRAARAHLLHHGHTSGCDLLIGLQGAAVYLWKDV